VSAPYSRVLTAPSPATSGTTLTVAEDDGAKFPTPPFVSIVWPVQFNPTPANSEELEVSKVEGDVFTFERGANPIAIETGMMLGVLSTVPAIKLGETIRLEISYTDPETPYTLRLQRPDGTVATATGALGLDDENETVAWAEVLGTMSGHWEYRWEVGSEKAATPDAGFFVAFTSTQ
jgi:hypothetical protein